MLVFGITLVTLGSVVRPIREKFAVAAASAGELFSLLPFGILAGSLVFGPFADRYGYKVILMVSVLCIFAGLQGIGYADSFALLKGCILLLGLGGGMVNGAANALVADLTVENKGANLSLLGVCFAIGALGMPFVLAMLHETVAALEYVSFVAYIVLAVGIVVLATRFPDPKLKQGISLARVRSLVTDRQFLFIGFFLFFQSGYEAIINNWTTTYLTDISAMSRQHSLYGLTFFVGGMAVMRLVLGSVLRGLQASRALIMSFAFLFAALGLLQWGTGPFVSYAALVCLGAGLAGGFPILLGIVAERFADVSGTSFSIAISIALTGNILINYTTGIVVDRYGVYHLLTIAIALTLAMCLLAWLILRKKTLTA